MKKIIYIFLLIGFGLNAQTSLLFKTDFEGTVALSDRDRHYKDFSGSSLGYTFVTDGQLGMGSSGNGIHMIDFGTPANLDVALETTIGHLGVSTTALHQQVVTRDGQNCQTPWQFNNITTNPDEFYMSYWVKFGADDIATNKWRALWEYKTENYTGGDSSGARMAFFAYKDNFGDEYFRLQLDTDPAPVYVWWDKTKMTIPRDEWFKFEIYFKFRNDNTGAAWAKINGVTVAEVSDVPTTQGDNAIKFFITAQVYGNEDGQEQWVDDVEIWDGIPDSDPNPVTANAGEERTICENESVTLTATGGTTYFWSTGATTASITVSPSSTQTYTVTASDSNGNKDSDDVIVAVNSITANAGEDVTIDEGQSTTLNASDGGTYLWNTGATSQSITVSPLSTQTYSVTVTQNGCEDTDEVKVTVNPTTGSVSADAGSDESICLGENVTLTASGGSGYSWNTGATTQSITVNPNSTTTYTVTVTEGAESDTDQVVVTVNDVTANAGTDVTIDEGNSVNLTASGGDTYKWSTGATTQSITISPITTVDYTVTATKNGCEDTDIVRVIVNPSTLNANAGSDVAICNGGSTVLTASGGSSYTWNTGATTASITVSPSTTQTYTVTARDGSGNSDSDDVIVTVNSVTANAGVDKAITLGETVKLTASGGDSYTWNTGATGSSITVSPTSTSDYTVTVTKNGCSDTDSVKVSVTSEITNPPPAEAFAGDDFSICLGESVTLNASGGDSYTWSTGDSNTNIDVNPTRTTTYTLSATRGGITDTDTVTVSVENCNISALPEDVLVNEISIYPNPTSDIVNINVPNLSSDMNVELISSNGSLVYKETINKKSNGFYEIDLSRRLAKGVYFVRLFNADQYFIEKIILN